VISSGKNMGVFKAIGYPDEVAKLYKLDNYKAYMWLAHGRYPTNTRGWWGGAHPFSILDNSIVHNGEITSYGTNNGSLSRTGINAAISPILKFWLICGIFSQTTQAAHRTCIRGTSSSVLGTDRANAA